MIAFAIIGYIVTGGLILVGIGYVVKNISIVNKNDNPNSKDDISSDE
jgi:hypothetical protein|tara:strand:+ start:361 stop:501 length:141 start_codon:yes stop_codon:yes gene_type:complete